MPPPIGAHQYQLAAGRLAPLAADRQSVGHIESIHEETHSRRTDLDRGGSSKAFLLIDGSHDIEPIQDEESLHRGVGDSLVPIDERMILGQREPESGCLVLDGRIEIVVVIETELAAAAEPQSVARTDASGVQRSYPLHRTPGPC